MADWRGVVQYIEALRTLQKMDIVHDPHGLQLFVWARRHDDVSTAGIALEYARNKEQSISPEQFAFLGYENKVIGDTLDEDKRYEYVAGATAKTIDQLRSIGLYERIATVRVDEI